MKPVTTWLPVLALAGILLGCQPRPRATEEEGIAVTAWGERYEIFAEADPLIAGQLSKSHTHVTILKDFAPLREGTVSAVLAGDAGPEQVFRRDEALRDGIFSIEITPARAGIFDLSFRVESAAGAETIPAGRVRVGEGDSLGLLVEPPHYGPSGGAAVPVPTGEPISFLKEEQWRTSFATAWAAPGRVLGRTGGPARVRPAAGGEAILSSPLDGIVAVGTRAFVGMEHAAGSTVIRLTPRVASERSLEAIRSDLGLAEARLERLEKLLAAEAVSVAEVEEQRAHVRTLSEESLALRGEGSAVEVRAPFAGRIAEVLVVPGEAVEAGSPLVRLVRVKPIWVEVSLRPEEASQLDQGIAGLIVRPTGGSTPLTFPRGQFRLVSRSPEIDRATGSVVALFEVLADSPLRPGAVVEAEVLLHTQATGILLPSSAVVDDGGVLVAYLQADGESFVRLEISASSPQGDSLVVEGVPRGSRVVTRGGAAIRRASLLRTGPPEGHIH